MIPLYMSKQIKLAMTRRLLTSPLRHLLNPIKVPGFSSFPTSQHNSLCICTHTHFFSCHFKLKVKPNPNSYCSTYKHSQFLSSARSSSYANAVQMARLLKLKRAASWLFCFSLQRRAGVSQRPPVYRFRPVRSDHKMTPDDTVWFLIGANVAVYKLWRIMGLPFMKKHFLLSLDNFKNGRLYTIITYAFSHFGTINLILNMLLLRSFGRPIAHSFGPEFLLQLYLGGAFMGSILFCVKHAFPNSCLGYGTQNAIEMGAGAPLHAMIFLCLFLPKNVVHVHPLALISGSTLVIFLFVVDLWKIIHKKGKGFRGPSLGGTITGILVCAGIRRRMR